MNGMRVFGAATLAALFLGAPSANAAIVDVTYTGTVAAGFDQTGLFGSPNGNLAGDSYQVMYAFNTVWGNYYSFPTESNASGGSSVGVLSPSLGVTVTINGVSVSSNLNGWFDQAYGYNDGVSSSGQYHTTSFFNVGPSSTTSNFLSNFVYAANLTIPANISSPFSYDVQSGDTQAGSVSFSTYDNSGNLLVNTYATANITNLTVSVISVPGPIPGAGIAGVAALAIAGLYVRTRRA